MDDEDYEVIFREATERFSAGQLQAMHRLAMERLDDVQNPRDRVLAYLKALDQVLLRFDSNRYADTLAKLNKTIDGDPVATASLVFEDDAESDFERREIDLKSVVFPTGEVRSEITDLIGQIQNDFGPDRGPQRGGGRGFER
ncbi:MAG: hypothetical protein ACKO1J_11425 [Tagaea sp.]